jgi:hypothetical protein
MRFKLLTDESDNVKLSKSAKSKYVNVGLSLAPHKLSGNNVCQHATPECIAHCVAFAGNGGVFPAITVARIRKTRLFFDDRATFMAQLRADLTKALEIARATGKRVACRLNVFSDLPWERIAADLFREFPEIQFYDYTKSYSRAADFAAGNFPENYHLTYSRSEINERKAIETLLRGGNVAVVLPQTRSQDLPAEWHGFPVVDGDKSDLRFMDPPGSVIGLRAKGTMRNAGNGMVDRTNTTTSALDNLT